MSNLSIGDLWTSSYDALAAVGLGVSSTIYRLPTREPPSFSVYRISALSLLLFIIFIVCKTLYRRFFHPLAKFPGPTFPAVTRLFEAYHVLIKNDWLENLEDLHRQYGPVVRIGPNELHFVDHAFCLEHHKRSSLIKCTNYYGPLNKLMSGLASPHAHSERKSHIQPLFTGQTLLKFSASTMNDHLETLHNRLASDLRDSEVNLTHIIWAYTNDMMMSYLFGEDFGYLKESDLAKGHDTLRAFSAIDLVTVLRTMPPFKKMLDIFPGLRRFSPLGKLDRLVGSRLNCVLNNDPVANPCKGNENVLARLWEELRDEQLVVQEAAQSIFIGNESLLSNLTFLLYYMIQNPECIKKLRAELDTLDHGLYGHRVWRDPKVMRLSYLDAICKESARLSSPGWHRQPRQIAEPINYNDTVIPPMTSMSFTLRMLEHDPVLYPEPDSFRPDRWLGSTQEAQDSRSSSVTFGTGTRTCLGQL